MEMPKYFKCSVCGNFVETIRDSGSPLICCGQPMVEQTANTVEASKEKHVPMITRADKLITVQIGSLLHPALPEHHIEWIAVLTDKGIQRKQIIVGEAPTASFCIQTETFVAAFAYCNLHGLWKSSDVTEV